MQQCTAMLRERMGSDTGALQQTAAGGAPRPSSSTALACAPSTPTSLMRREDRAPSSPPDTALEAMGPVLESVLGSLTQVSPAVSYVAVICKGLFRWPEGVKVFCLSQDPGSSVLPFRVGVFGLAAGAVQLIRVVFACLTNLSQAAISQLNSLCPSIEDL